MANSSAKRKRLKLIGWIFLFALLASTVYYIISPSKYNAALTVEEGDTNTSVSAPANQQIDSIRLTSPYPAKK